MTEAIHPRREQIGGRGGPTGSLDDHDVLASMAYVISASGHREPLPVAGMAVGVIRRRLADRLNIDPTAQAMIGSQDVGDDVVLRAGEYLYFRRQAGEKGISCLEQALYL
jgi:hypothetical protein